MPWYSVTISAADILTGRDADLETAFTSAFIEGSRESTASLWWLHKLADGSITYFLSATPEEIGLAAIATFSPIECKEPDLSAVGLSHTGKPLTLEGGKGYPLLILFGDPEFSSALAVSLTIGL